MSKQLSGGQLLAAGLDGGNTMIFAKGKNANRFPYPAPEKKPLLSTKIREVFVFC